MDLLAARKLTSTADAALGMKVNLGGTLLAVVLSLAIAFLLANSIFRSARRLVQVAHHIADVDLAAFSEVAGRMAAGDLTARVNAKRIKTPHPIPLPQFWGRGMLNGEIFFPFIFSLPLPYGGGMGD